MFQLDDQRETGVMQYGRGSPKSCLYGAGFVGAPETNCIEKRKACRAVEAIDKIKELTAPFTDFGGSLEPFNACLAPTHIHRALEDGEVCV